MADSDQRTEYDVREKIGMIGSIPPPPQNNTDVKILHEIMGVLSDKMKTLSKEEAVQAEKRVALDEKMKTLSKEESIQAEKRVVLNQRMEMLLKMLDAVL